MRGPRWRASTGTGRSDASIRPIGRCAASFPQPPMKRSKLPDARRMTRCMSASSGPLSGNRCMSGELLADATYGPEALQNLHFVPTATGDFHLWKLPDTSRRIANRYAVALDIGGRSPNADWSVISVLDRIAMMDGGCGRMYRYLPIPPRPRPNRMAGRAGRGMVLSCAAGRRSE